MLLPPLADPDLRVLLKQNADTCYMISCQTLPRSFFLGGREIFSGTSMFPVSSLPPKSCTASFLRSDSRLNRRSTRMRRTELSPVVVVRFRMWISAEKRPRGEAARIQRRRAEEERGSERGEASIEVQGV